MFDINYSTLEVLGEGNNGVAYFCPKNNVVVKLTKCENEYISSTSLVGKNVPIWQTYIKLLH